MGRYEYGKGKQTNKNFCVCVRPGRAWILVSFRMVYLPWKGLCQIEESVLAVRE